jgi:hypothetical protein
MYMSALSPGDQYDLIYVEEVIEQKFEIMYDLTMENDVKQTL